MMFTICRSKQPINESGPTAITIVQDRFDMCWRALQTPFDCTFRE